MWQAADELGEQIVMETAMVYVAVSPGLIEELHLEAELGRLHAVARVERWGGPGDPAPEAIAGALRRAQVLITGWGTPALEPLERWAPESFAVRLIAHTAGTVKKLIPVAAIEH